LDQWQAQPKFVSGNLAACHNAGKRAANPFGSKYFPETWNKMADGRANRR